MQARTGSLRVWGVGFGELQSPAIRRLPEAAWDRDGRGRGRGSEERRRGKEVEWKGEGGGDVGRKVTARQGKYKVPEYGRLAKHKS